MTYLPDNKVTHIVIHYSATPIEKDFTAADIDRMHKARGFKEIGYHYFIRKDGTAEAGRDLSKPGRFEQGAHSKGENDSSIGICYEGGVTQSNPNHGFDSRTPAQVKTMIRLIDQLMDRYPGAIVEGHRDMPGAATQCPGFDAGAWWDEVEKERLNTQSHGEAHTGPKVPSIGVGSQADNSADPDGFFWGLVRFFTGIFDAIAKILGNKPKNR